MFELWRGLAVTVRRCGFKHNMRQLTDSAIGVWIIGGWVTVWEILTAYVKQRQTAWAKSNAGWQRLTDAQQIWLHQLYKAGIYGRAAIQKPLVHTILGVQIPRFLAIGSVNSGVWCTRLHSVTSPTKQCLYHHLTVFTELHCSHVAWWVVKQWDYIHKNK